MQTDVHRASATQWTRQGGLTLLERSPCATTEPQHGQRNTVQTRWPLQGRQHAAPRPDVCDRDTHAPGCSPAQALSLRPSSPPRVSLGGWRPWQALRQTLQLLPAQIPSWQHSVSHACFVFAVCVTVMLALSCSLVSVHWHDV